MKKFGTRILAAVVTSSLIVTPVMAAPSVDDLKNKKAATENEVSSLQEELTSIMAELSELEEELISVGEQKIQAESDLKDAEEKEKEQYEAMKKRIQYMYEEGNTSVFEALITADNFSELLSKAEYVQNVHTYDREQLNEYIATKKKIEELKVSLEEDEKELESKQTEYEAKEDRLNATIESKRAEVADLDSEIQAAAEAAAKAARERQEREEEARRQQQQAQAANSNNTTTSSSGSSGSSNSGSSSSGSSSSGSSNSGSSNSGSSSSGSSSSGSSTSSGSNVDGGTIVSRAYSQLGKPYVWGACGPSGFDCSGFVSYCLTGSYTRLGTTYTFMGWPRVSDPQPGDVVTTATHCGIYIGNGQMIHAPHTGDVVKVGPVQSGMIYVRCP